MSIDRCPNHDTAYDTDFLDECPQCSNAETVSDEPITITMSFEELDALRHAAQFAAMFMNLSLKRMSPYTPENYRQDTADSIKVLNEFRERTYVQHAARVLDRWADQKAGQA